MMSSPNLLALLETRNIALLKALQQQIHGMNQTTEMTQGDDIQAFNRKRKNPHMTSEFSLALCLLQLWIFTSLSHQKITVVAGPCLQAIQDPFFAQGGWLPNPSKIVFRISEYLWLTFSGIFLSRPLKQRGVTDDALLEAMYFEQ